ncbi:MAG: trypsin-like peptidase domain-containing protein [Pirellulaceae bacterium]
MLGVLFCYGDHGRFNQFDGTREHRVPAVSSGQDLETMRATAKAVRFAAGNVQANLVAIESFGGSGAIAGRIAGIRKQGEGNTTGLLLGPDGYIVTSTFNFIQRPPVITVITLDGERHYAEMLGRDDTRKLCILKINDAPAVSEIKSVDPASVVVGQWAVSVGVGFGDVNSAVSTGIISATNRIGGRAIQTDANISPASYGGPLVDIHGDVLGICVPLNPPVAQAIERCGVV